MFLESLITFKATGQSRRSSGLEVPPEVQHHIVLFNKQTAAFLYILDVRSASWGTRRLRGYSKQRNDRDVHDVT